MYNLKPKHTLSHANRLRRESTDEERRMWFLLRERLPLFKFRRQHSMPPYIVDFCCLSHKVIIELDGSHYADRQLEYDQKRDQFLQEKGFRIIRFWNHEFMKNQESAIDQIVNMLENL